MKRNELKTGHLLEFDDGSVAIVMRDSFDGDKYIAIIRESFWSHGDLDALPINLSDKRNMGNNIVAIYEPNKKYSPYPFDLCNYDKVWKRSDIEIDIKINGKEAKLSDLSEETLLNLRENN